MSDILSDSELNRLAERNKIYEQDGWADEPETELVAELLGDIDGIINSHRALAGERDKLTASRRVHELDNHHNALACGYCSGPLRDEVERLQSQMRELTEERQQMEQIIGGKSFRERAVQAIREKGEEWRRQGERWQQKFSQETNPIIARQDMSDRDGAFNHMSAAFAIIELVESLPLEPEQEDKP